MPSQSSARRSMLRRTRQRSMRPLLSLPAGSGTLPSYIVDTITLLWARLGW